MLDLHWLYHRIFLLAMGSSFVFNIITQITSASNNLFLPGNNEPRSAMRTGSRNADTFDADCIACAHLPGSAGQPAELLIPEHSAPGGRLLHYTPGHRGDASSY